MATNYPNSLDSLTNPTTTDPVNNPSHAVQHANANDAIEALQAKVGTNNSAVATSLDYRVRQLELNPVTSTANKIEQVVVNNTGSTLLEGQVVYASGSVGASGKLRVSLSSNAAESTSTKTFGILAEDIINGGEGLVVTEGIVEGINTVGANDGDPVFLGVNGEKLFGLANKPSAPAHLVFLGIVVRGGQTNTGSIFVKIQNGFELDELHDVSLASLADKDLLTYDSATGLWKNKTFTTLDITTKTYVDTALNNLSNTVTTDYVPISDVGQPDGVASLDSTGKIPLAQMGNLVAGAPTALDTLNELAAALGDDANFASTVTTSLSDKASLTSANTFTTSPQTINIASTSAVGLVVQASVGQTTDIQQWKNSSGNVIARLTKDATLSVGSSSVAPGIITAVAFSAGQNPIVVQGASGQTGDLQIWRNSAGTVLAAVSNTGTIRSSIFANTTVGLTYIATNFDTSGIGIVAISAAQKGLIVRGAASQTANLQEWQNSSGTVLAKVDASGNINAVGLSLTSTVSGTMFSVDPTYGGITSRGGAVGFSGSASLNIGTRYTAQSAIVASGFSGQSVPTVIIKAVASQTSNLQEWQNSSGTVLASIASTGQINAGAGFYTDWAGVGTGRIGAAHLSVSSQYLGNIVSIFKGVSGQTANLTEWQNSSGAILASVSAGGDLTIPSARVAIGITAPISLVMLGTVAAGATFVPIVAKGAASQTADLQQWQNSAGTVNARIDAYGTFQNGTAGGYGAWINVQPAQASDKGIIIRGATSQTANLQEWQDSVGTVKAFVRSDGFIRADASLQTPTIYGTSATNGTQANIATAWTFLTNVATNTGIIVKGAASQTANLQEWQNSAGTVLARINAGGVIKSSILAGLTDGYSLIQFNYDTNGVGITTGAAAQKGLIIRGAASQTANLQEWQNSAGTVLASIDSNGQLRTPQILNIASFNNSRLQMTNTGSLFDVGVASNVALRVRGAPSQTANLQEWQDSAGTVLAKITSTGAFDATAITVNGQPIPTGLTSSAVSSNITLSSNYKYFVDTTAVRTLTLPASPVLGDEIQIFDASNSAGTNNVTINSNSGKINGSVQNAIIDVNGAAVSFVYTGSTYGWRMG